MAKSTGLGVFVILGIISFLGTGGELKWVQAQQITTNFYNVSCPSVEQIVRSAMTAHFQQDPSIAAHILRLQFHDCAATGCDASLLLTGPDSEQDAPPNLTVLGYDIINDIKAQLEMNCTGIVSCSDIMAMAARDAASLTGGPNFSVPLGRFDSTFSGGSNVNLPSGDASVTTAITFFQNLGLSAEDLVILLGAHTIGVAHCSSFDDRMYNFENTGLSDPSFDPSFLVTLKTICPQGNPNASTTVALDPQSEFAFGDHFYSQLTKHRGVLALDEAIFTNNVTNGIVDELLNSTLFFQNFANSMIKMGLVGVKNSTAGNIRSNCAIVGTSPINLPAPSPTITIGPTPVFSPSSGIVLSPAHSPGIPGADSPMDSAAPSPVITIGPTPSFSPSPGIALSPADSPGIPSVDSPMDSLAPSPPIAIGPTPVFSPSIGIALSPADSPGILGADSPTDSPANSPLASG